MRRMGIPSTHSLNALQNYTEKWVLANYFGIKCKIKCMLLVTYWK